MTVKSEVFNDRKSVIDSPPTYNNIYASASAEFVKCPDTQPSLFSFFVRNNNKRTMVLSRIRDIVSTTDFISSSVAPIVEACAAALSPGEFSDLLQKPNIEGHTAMYWAIVNHQREAISAFAAFIPRFSSVCSSNVRLTCMSISDHCVFAQLNSARASAINPKDKSLRYFLNCPPDEVQVQDAGDRRFNSQFVAYFCIRMFQKRLRVSQKLGIEFVASERIWLLQFNLLPEGDLHVGLSLAEHCLPAKPEMVLVIKAHSGRATPSQDMRVAYTIANSKGCSLVHKE
ncbi:hypothetical protein F4604DRAFT_1923786 [Suillus subluteus]|nr:hypothetical protein F4604DRAFT_1923786 [Suillus subluteus]